MRRIIAEILESNWSTPDGKGPTGLPWREVKCLVKLLSSVPESHHLPDDIKDTTLTVRRLALFDYEYEPGKKIIVTPDECESAVGRHADIPEFGSLRGRVATYRTDINSDGFAERVVENSFVRVVIGPRYGARIWEIYHKRAGWNPLHATYNFGSDWYELGGQEDHFSDHGQGEFWNSRFEEKEMVTDETGFRGVYEFKSANYKGVTVVKEVRVPVDAPLVYFQFTTKYAGAEKAPEDGKLDEFEMRHWQRVGVAVSEEKKGSYVCVVPTKAKLHRLRGGRGWRAPRHFSFTAPYILTQDEDTGHCLAFLLEPAAIHYSEVKDHRKAYETIEPKMRHVKVPKDGEQSYGFALVVGDAAEAGADGLSLSATGLRDGQEMPVFALNTRGASGAVEPSALQGGCIGMNEIEYPGLPKIAHGTAWLSSDGGQSE